MSIIDQAREFAVMAHMGQFRKSNPDQPEVAHSIAVAEILTQYGYDDHVIAAGFLHDVVEDTKYTIADIKNIFGADVAQLVQTATEPDKSLSWRVRKQHTIDEIKNSPLRNKVIVAADKIHNTEGLTALMKMHGLDGFKVFKAGPNDQLWYVSGVYNSLIFNENPNTPIFVRLRNALNLFQQEIAKQRIK